MHSSSHFATSRNFQAVTSPISYSDFTTVTAISQQQQSSSTSSSSSSSSLSTNPSNSSAFSSSLSATIASSDPPSNTFVTPTLSPCTNVTSNIKTLTTSAATTTTTTTTTNNNNNNINTKTTKTTKTATKTATATTNLTSSSSSSSSPVFVNNVPSQSVPYIPVTPPSSQPSQLNASDTPSCSPPLSIQGNPNYIINHSYRLFQSSTIINTISSIPELASLSIPQTDEQFRHFEDFILLNDFHITPNLTLWLYSTVGLMSVPQGEALLASQRLLHLLSNLDFTLSTRLYLLPSGFSMIDVVFTISLFPAFRNLLNQTTCLPLVHLSNWFIRCVSDKIVQLVYEKLMLSPSAAPACSNKKAAWPNKVTIDDYNIIRVLGKGCMGKVLLVRHKKSGGLYAMKSISKSSVIAHKELDHTLAERKILSTIAQIQHPFLVQCHNAFTSERELFLVLDFVSGGDMATQLAKFGRLPPNRVQFYACEIVLGLCELHRLGIVYRDLKPENILLNPDGHVVLTDFGLSKMVSPTKNRTKTFAGTAEYLAPEILLNQEYGFEVDWWSFGTLLYEMYCGVTPFWAENQALMYKRVLEDPLMFPKFMPLDIQKLIAGLLERNPSHRLTGPLVQTHVYFKLINWNDVYSKRLPVPFVPSLRSPMDVSNFEEMFTSMSPRLSPATHDLSASLQASFAGYSWAPPAPIHEQSAGVGSFTNEHSSMMMSSPPSARSQRYTPYPSFTSSALNSPSFPSLTSNPSSKKVEGLSSCTNRHGGGAPLYSQFTIHEESEDTLHDEEVSNKHDHDDMMEVIENKDLIREEDEEDDLLALDLLTQDDDSVSPFFNVPVPSSSSSASTSMSTPLSSSTVSISASTTLSPSSISSSSSSSSSPSSTCSYTLPTNSSSPTPRPIVHSPAQSPTVTPFSNPHVSTLTFSRTNTTKPHGMFGGSTSTTSMKFSESHWSPQPPYPLSQKSASFA